MTTATCPERSQLEDFWSGNLSDEQIVLLQRHLETCDSCGETIRGLRVDDTLDRVVRSAWAGVSESTGSPWSGELESFLDRLSELPQRSSGHDAHATAADETLRMQEILPHLSPAEQEGELGRLAQYRVLRWLGVGGSSVVFLAEDRDLQRLVALKILRPSMSESARLRFVQEARAAAAIDHPHVVTIYDVGQAGPLAFLAMRWQAGESLESLIQREGSLPVALTRQVGEQIACGLAAIHSKHHVHRDLKPANIWLAAGDQHATILDFGLARLTENHGQLTETGFIAGTPAYMSPEQAQGRDLDARSDLFSLGTVLYRMLTGRLPFQGDNPLAILRSIQQDAPTPPQALDPGIPQPLSDLVLWMMQKDRDRRPASAEVVTQAMAGEVTPIRGQATPPTSTPSASGRKRTRNRIMIALALLPVAGFLAFQFVVRITTSKGVTEFTTDDPKVQVQVQPAESTHIMPGMKLRIQVTGTIQEHPIDGDFVVEPEGTVPLGPMYGRVRVEGLAIAGAEETISRHLKQVLRDPRVMVTRAMPQATSNGVQAEVTASNSVARQSRQVEPIDRDRISDSELHVVSVYGPKDSHQDDRIFVEVRPTEKPMVLVVASYMSAQWHIELAEGANLKQVIVAGYFEQDIQGLPPDIPVAHRTYFPLPGPKRDTRHSGDWFYGFAWNTKETREMVRALKEQTGLSVSTFQGTNHARRFVVDGQLGTLEP